MKRATLLAGAALTLIGLSGTAMAAGWTAKGAGTGAAKAGKMTDSGIPQLNGTVSGTTIPIKWAAGAVSSGATIGYIVERADTASPTTWTQVCGTTLVSGVYTPMTPTSASAPACSDTGVAGHSYNYRVTAAFGTTSAGKWRGATKTTASPIAVPVAATKLALSAPANWVAGTPQNVTVTAQKADNSTDTSYNGTLTWGGTAFVASPNATEPSAGAASFTSGVATVQITLTNAASGTLTVSASGLTGASASVTVLSSKQLGFGTTCSGILKNASCSTTITRPSTVDAWGNGGTAASLTVSLAATQGTWKNGSTVITTIVIGAGSTASASLTVTPPGGSYGSATWSVSGAPFTGNSFVTTSS